MQPKYFIKKAGIGVVFRDASLPLSLTAHQTSAECAKRRSAERDSLMMHHQK
jgi:hypothetical protein